MRTVDDPSRSWQQVSAAEQLRAAIDELATERIQRLVDRLEATPEPAVTAGFWRSGSPMVLAGFDPAAASPDVPEARFAAVWDRVAVATRRRWWSPPAALLRGRLASAADVGMLLRTANGALAHRAAVVPDVQREMTRIETKQIGGSF
jgi:hypothetical protein